MADKTQETTKEELLAKAVELCKDPVKLCRLLEIMEEECKTAYIEKGRKQIIDHVEKCFKSAKITAFTGEGGFTQIIMPSEDFEALKEGKDV